MQKFKFKLQRLANMKLSAERQVRQELEEIQHACLKRQDELSSATKKIDEWSLYYNRVLKNGAQWVELASIDHHLQRLYRFKEQSLISLEVLERKKSDLFEQYKGIKREVKTLEHLKEKRFADYCAESRVEEQKIADELALVRFARERAVS